MAEQLLSLLYGDFSGATWNFGSVTEIDGSIHEAADSQNGPQNPKSYRYLDTLFRGYFYEDVGGCAIFVVGRRQLLEIAWNNISRWWFKALFIFTPTRGDDPIWRSYFSNGLKPPTRYI